MAKYGIDYLKKLEAGVEAFEEAFEDWMGTQCEFSILEGRGLFPTVATKDGVDEAEVRRLELKVAETAGFAAKAVVITGSHMVVQGIGLIDPIANWMTMRNPKATLAPQDIRNTAAAVRGRLRSLITDAEAGTNEDLPSFSPALMHPVVWNGAAAHWTAHQYRVAVREASEGLTAHWKDRLGRHDVDGTKFWQQTLSNGPAEEGRPKLRWPGNADDKTSKSMRGGLEHLATSLTNLATGLTLTVRNVTTHTRDELSEQEAMERLAAYSFLARLLDQCEIDRAE